MAGWSGFTDEDLRRMRQTTPTDDGPSSVDAQRKSMARRPRPQQQRGKPTKSGAVESKSHVGQAQTTSDTVDPSMRLSSQGNRIPKDLKSTDSVDSVSTVSERNNNNSSKSGPDGEDTKMRNGAIEAKAESQSQLDVTDVKELDEGQVLSMELGNVEKFQQRQKMIEEANKHKRALLAKAIEDRKKKAKAEANKLMKVQQELNHLDSLLTADVNIIRDKIEAASLEYMDAQKRYEKAEKEFVAAKMDLFSKGETKEQLTEHLYTIIHQNEVRKAKKLVELMEKLAMDVTPEEMELTIPAIPQLTNFTAVATLHDPQHPPHTPLFPKHDGLKETPKEEKDSVNSNPQAGTDPSAETGQGLNPSHPQSSDSNNGTSQQPALDTQARSEPGATTPNTESSGTCDTGAAGSNTTSPSSPSPAAPSITSQILAPSEANISVSVTGSAPGDGTGMGGGSRETNISGGITLPGETNLPAQIVHISQSDLDTTTSSATASLETSTTTTTLTASSSTSPSSNQPPPAQTEADHQTSALTTATSSSTTTSETVAQSAKGWTHPFS